jgi:hypothetical protein
VLRALQNIATFAQMRKELEEASRSGFVCTNFGRFRSEFLGSIGAMALVNAFQNVEPLSTVLDTLLGGV